MQNNRQGEKIKLSFNDSRVQNPKSKQPNRTNPRGKTKLSTKPVQAVKKKKEEEEENKDINYKIKLKLLNQTSKPWHPAIFPFYLQRLASATCQSLIV